MCPKHATTKWPTCHTNTQMTITVRVKGKQDFQFHQQGTELKTSSCLSECLSSSSRAVLDLEFKASAFASELEIILALDGSQTQPYLALLSKHASEFEVVLPLYSFGILFLFC